MRKNYGFTLMEMLGSLIIIGIVAVIILPITFNVVNRVRLNALRDSAYGLLESANLYYAQYQNVNTLRFDKDEDTDTLADLHYKGNVKKGTVIIDKKGRVTICLNDGTNSAYKNYKDNSIILETSKVCSIPKNKSIVYLDDNATKIEYDNEELTTLVNEMQEEISSLKTKNIELENSKANKIELDTINSNIETIEAKTETINAVANNAQALAANAATKTELNNLSSIVNNHTTSINGLKYGKGVSISGHIYTGGFITSGGLDYNFSIPINGVISSDVTSITTNSMSCIVRQNGYYLIGTGTSYENIKSDNYTFSTWRSGSSTIEARITKKAVSTGTTNNDSAGIDCYYSFTFN